MLDSNYNLSISSYSSVLLRKPAVNILSATFAFPSTVVIHIVHLIISVYIVICFLSFLTTSLVLILY